LEQVMTRPCAGKVALVVGGTRGIGRAATLALASAGAAVAPAGRGIENAVNVAENARAYGVEALPLALDVSDPAASERAVEEVKRRFGRLDVLVANAGINPYFLRAERITPEVWDEVMAVNLRGLFFSIQAAAKQMLTQNSGSIISISSATAMVGVSHGLPYVATKGGLDAMTRSLAVEWADRGVRVNGVAPGYVATDLTQQMRNHDGMAEAVLNTVPLRRFAEPGEVAGMIVYLASDASSYVTGQTIVIDGGFAIGRQFARSK
jgi:NAD(P)-dependent dehydrogenase (short-subunit alcohol dehydrogenase family)